MPYFPTPTSPPPLDTAQRAAPIFRRAGSDRTAENIHYTRCSLALSAVLPTLPAAPDGRSLSIHPAACAKALHVTCSRRPSRSQYSLASLSAALIRAEMLPLNLKNSITESVSRFSPVEVRLPSLLSRVTPCTRIEILDSMKNMHTAFCPTPGALLVALELVRMSSHHL